MIVTRMVLFSGDTREMRELSSIIIRIIEMTGIFIDE